MPIVTIPRRILLATLSIILIVFAWIWWNRPQQADLAGYVPASSLVYLECNNLPDVADAMTGTESWNKLKPFIGESTNSWTSVRSRQLMAFTGFGPTAGVILARAQVAMIMLDLGAREEGDTITLKPEAALLIETHTSEGRIRSTVEEALSKFADRSYGQPTFKRTEMDGDDFLIWISPNNDRQIVATIDGSLVIVANSERAVSACLAARRGQRPNLLTDPELQPMRATISANKALAFGFVSSSHTAELLSVSAPVLFGRAPESAQFDRLIANSAPKILASAGWTARAADRAIEDHYFFALQPSVATRMRPLFQPIPQSSVLNLVPKDVHSLTLYRFQEPVQTWRGLQTTLSSQLDTLSSILMVSILKSALLPYGVADPERFLGLVGPEMMTARLKPDSTGSILIARVRDESGLRELLKSTPEKSHDEPERELATHFQDGYVLMGSPVDIQECVRSLAQSNSSPLNLPHYGADSSSANIVTYSKDGQRVRNFIAAIARAQGKPIASESAQLEHVVDQVPYSTTETSLTEKGLDRRTRSAFGQFGALVALLFPGD